jgi:hypothetical protein
MTTRTTNLGVNLNKIRAANLTDRPDRAVFVFDYYAPSSDSHEVRQRPLVRVVRNSLRKSKDGSWVFKGVNLYRIDNKKISAKDAVRTFRLDRINGLLHRP